MTREVFDNIKWHFQCHVSGGICCLTEKCRIPGLLRFTVKERCKDNEFEFTDPRIIYSYNGKDYKEKDIDALLAELNSKGNGR